MAGVKMIVVELPTVEQVSPLVLSVTPNRRRAGPPRNWLLP